MGVTKRASRAPKSTLGSVVYRFLAPEFGQKAAVNAPELTAFFNRRR
jgi:hypothetical protein